MSNKYFWLKLPRGFFKRHDVKLIRALENGDAKAFFYLALMTESIDHEGRLRFSEDVPYEESELASVTDTDPVIAAEAIEYLKHKLLMIIEEDGTIFMPKALELIGSESAWAGKKREYRGRSEETSEPSEDIPGTGKDIVPECPDIVRQSKSKRESKIKREREEAPLPEEKSKNEDAERLVTEFYAFFSEAAKVRIRPLKGDIQLALDLLSSVIISDAIMTIPKYLTCRAWFVYDKDDKKRTTPMLSFRNFVQHYAEIVSSDIPRKQQEERDKRTALGHYPDTCPNCRGSDLKGDTPGDSGKRFLCLTCHECFDWKDGKWERDAESIPEPAPEMPDIF